MRLRALILGMIALATFPTITLANPLTTVDSLKTELSHASADTLQARLLADIAWEYRKIDIDSAIVYGTESVRIAHKITDKKISASNLGTLSILYKAQGDYSNALQCAQQSLALRIELDDKRGQAGVLTNMGNICRLMGDYDKAFNHLIKGLKIRENLQDKAGMAASYNSLGSFHSIRGLQEEALTFYNKCLALRKELNQGQGIASVTHNIGNIYYEQGKYESAIHYYTQSLDTYLELEDARGVADAYNNLANAHEQKKEYAKALSLNREALVMREKLGDLQGQLDSYINIGSCHRRLNQESEALKAFHNAEQLAGKIGGEQDRQLIHHQLYATYLQQKEYKDALENFQIFTDLKDSIYSTESEKRIAELETQYQTEKIERELAVANQKLTQEAITRYLLIGGVVILGFALLMGLILLRSYQQRQRAQRELSEHKEQMGRQIIIDLLKEQEVESLNSMLEGQEKERRRIALDLHDGLGGTMAAVKVSLFTLQKKLEGLPEETHNLYTQTQHLLEEACKDVRRIAHDMADNTLQHAGLIPAVTEMCEMLSTSSPFSVQLETSGLGEERLENHMEIHLYRMLQEIFQNVVKHASATQVAVQLTRHADQLNMLVEDNGKGFDYEPGHLQNGMGLANIAARVKKLNGTFQIDSAINQGTTIIIDIPL